MRTYSLLQIGSTFAPLEAQKARGLLRDAFLAAVLFRSHDLQIARSPDDPMAQMIR
jgi:hypothetical protein